MVSVVAAEGDATLVEVEGSQARCHRQASFPIGERFRFVQSKARIDPG
jgi:hypothetical protein